MPGGPHLARRATQASPASAAGAPAAPSSAGSAGATYVPSPGSNSATWAGASGLQTLAREHRSTLGEATARSPPGHQSGPGNENPVERAARTRDFTDRFAAVEALRLLGNLPDQSPDRHPCRDAYQALKIAGSEPEVTGCRGSASGHASSPRDPGAQGGQGAHSPAAVPVLITEQGGVSRTPRGSSNGRGLIPAPPHLDRGPRSAHHNDARQGAKLGRCLQTLSGTCNLREIHTRRPSPPPRARSGGTNFRGEPTFVGAQAPLAPARQLTP